MEQAATSGSTDEVNIIALIDRTPEDTGGYGYTDDNLGSIPEWTDAKLIRVEKDDFTVLQELGEIDMGDPQTLAWFIATGINSFPAEKYGLVMSDHGGGIFGFGWDDTAPVGLGGEPSHLDLPEIAFGMQAGLAATDVEKFDFFGFHACLMAEYDVAAMVAPYADFMLASEEVMWGETWDWAAAMEFLTTSPGAGPEEFGKVVVETGVQPDFPPIVTMSLIDLEKVGALGHALGSLSETLVDNMDDIATEFGRQREAALEFGLDPGQQHSPFGMVDLGDLVSRLENVPDDVKVAANSVYEAINNSVVEFNAGEAAQSATGMAIYFPANPNDYSDEYDGFETSREWREVLAAYYESNQTPTPDGPTSTGPEFESPEAEIEVDEEGVLALARLANGSEQFVVSAEFLGGRQLPDGTVHYLIDFPAVIGAGDEQTVAGGWGLGYLRIGDGENTLDATLFLEPVPGSLKGAMLFIYQPNGGDQKQVVLQFTLDDETLEVTEPPRYFLFDDTGAVSQLVPDPGSLVAPVVLVRDPGGGLQFELLSDVGLDATVDPVLEFSGMATGETFNVALAAFDAAGNFDIASASGTVP